MNKSRELQLKTLDVLGNGVANLDETLNEIQRQTNPFDAEAKVYFFMQQAKLLSERAKNLHAEIHLANSAAGEWHDEFCLHGVNPMVQP